MSDKDLLNIFSRKKLAENPVPRSAQSDAEVSQSKTVDIRPMVKKEEKPKAPLYQAPKRQNHKNTELIDSIVWATRRQLVASEGDSDGAVSEQAMRAAIKKVCTDTQVKLDDRTLSDVIVTLQSDLFGWGVLQPLIDNPHITDIHCYDHETVVIQRGKESETTGLRWPSHEAYKTYIDRLLLRISKSLSTQQHTIDGSLPDGKRICAMHESVCGSRGPLLTIRVPRFKEVSIEGLYEHRVCPKLMVDYLGAIVGTGTETIIVSGQTGTGKTTLVRCLGSRFKGSESVIGVEDTPELNYPHEYYRSLVSRYANTEGVGEVTLQEHIKATLRLCPSRVILGEMRSPGAAEAFLEAAQTGHAGLSTVHARNSRETLTRLEALLGRAQAGVNIEVIRQQIALAVDLVVYCIRERDSGAVRIGEILEVGNFSEGQIQVRPIFRLVEEGDEPIWELQSPASSFDKTLQKNGVHLSRAKRYFTFEDAQGELNGRLH